MHNQIPSESRIPFLTPVVWWEPAFSAMGSAKLTKRDCFYTLAEFFFSYSPKMGERINTERTFEAKTYPVKLIYKPARMLLNLTTKPAIIAVQVVAQILRFTVGLLALRALATLAVALNGERSWGITRFAQWPTQGFSAWATGLTTAMLALLVVTKIYLRCTRTAVYPTPKPVETPKPIEKSETPAVTPDSNSVGDEESEEEPGDVITQESFLPIAAPDLGDNLKLEDDGHKRSALTVNPATDIEESDLKFEDEALKRSTPTVNPAELPEETD